MRAFALFLALATCQAAILTIGGLALRVAALTGVGLIDLTLLLVTGIQLPLLYFMLRTGSRRMGAAVLAVCFAVVVNVSFVATSAPAAAVTDNSSVFTLRNTAAFSSPNLDMVQNYTPSGPVATCPGSGGFNWYCSWSSDTFTSSQTLTAGTAQAELYLSNDPVPVLLRYNSNLAGTSNNVCTLNKPTTVVNGDVMLAACSFRGGSGTAVTAVPSGWTLAGSRIDESTTISLVVYSHVVTDASSEPASYSWSLSATVKLAASLVSYSGVATAAPIDAAAGQATPSATSHSTPAFTTTVSNDRLVTYFVTATCAAWTPPPGMTERSDTTFCTQSAGTNVDMETADMTLGAAGSTGPMTATNDAAATGIAMAVALKRDTAPATCNLTVQLAKPVQHRSTATNTANDSTSIEISKPAGVIDGDVMVATIGSNHMSGLTVTAPAGWTLVGTGGNFGSVTASVYTKAASGEPASYTWTFSAAVYIAAGISAYWNVDTVTTYDVQAGNATGGLSPATATITTTQPDEMLVASFIASINGSWTPPSGMNERFDLATTSTTFITVLQADGIHPPAGPVSKAATMSSSGASGTHIVALKSASGAGFLASGTASIASPASAALVSTSFAAPAVSFVTDDRLQLDVIAPNDSGNCSATVSFDAPATPSKLTLAITVPEGVGVLAALAPALPAVIRRWKARGA